MVWKYKGRIDERLNRRDNNGFHQATFYGQVMRATGSINSCKPLKTSRTSLVRYLVWLVLAGNVRTEKKPTKYKARLPYNSEFFFKNINN